jgi:hypothetical protein
MGLRERLQTVTQFFQSAASKGHRLRQEEARGENHAPSAGEQTRQREERRPRGMAAEDRSGEQAHRQRDRDRS